MYEPHNLSVADFKEDHWTRRLAYGLQQHCQSEVFSLSTIKGTGNGFRKFLADGLEVSATANKVFLFQGAPNLLIRSEAAVVMCGTDEKNDDNNADSQDGVIENCHQRRTVVLDLPEKIGELVACQHTVLAAKIL